MGGKPKGSSGREIQTQESGTKTDRQRRACTSDGTDHLLEAARHGWAVTVRYCILISVARWPALICGTGAFSLAAGYARARGWV